LATGGTNTTCFGAVLHDRIILESRTIIGTARANLSADAACSSMKIRTAMHEIRGQRADFGAIPEQTNVILF
jgi:hypothetical protein